MAIPRLDDASSRFEILYGTSITQIRLDGEVDFAAAGCLEAVEQMALEAGKPVGVDLSEVTFLDSTGLGFLARLVTAGSQAGWTLTVVGAQGPVADVIAVSGLAPVLQLVVSASEAPRAAHDSDFLESQEA